ncbi:MAG TPA: LapA family protein [Blastococcus sp.]|nr:LapA family protein [Blastococcus sp.]
MTTPEHRPVSAPGTDPTLTAPGPVAPTPPSSAPAETPRPRRTGRTIGRTLALALLIFVTVVLVLFVMFNTQTVRISLVFADVRAPLVLALLIAAVLGGLLVALTGAVMRARRKSR